MGTAQFGLKYGVANRTGKIPITEAATILQICRDHGVDTLDTAIAYGDSEAVLGEIGVKDFKIISKLPPLPKELVACKKPILVENWALSMIENSLQRLDVQSLDGLLMHNPADLMSPAGPALFNAVKQFQVQGLIKSFGLSIYDPDELDSVLPKFEINITQAPMNVIDRRLVNSSWLNRLVDKNIRVHTRSAFLQGALLLDRYSRHEFMGKWQSIWQEFDGWLKLNGMTPLEGAFAFLNNYRQIERIVVGVDNATQFHSILRASTGDGIVASEKISCDDPMLVNPSNW